ncbi:hypothetical protein C6946_29305 [Burkholderia thailandensis]|nr:hypothetical protein C6946_29305 [Burkholderia thailandensis]
MTPRRAASGERRAQDRKRVPAFDRARAPPRSIGSDKSMTGARPNARLPASPRAASRGGAHANFS